MEDKKLLLENENKFKWHTPEETNSFGQQLMPEIETPILIMREFEDLETGLVHKEYESGFLNEYCEIESNDGGWICDWLDVDGWKYIETYGDE